MTCIHVVNNIVNSKYRNLANRLYNVINVGQACLKHKIHYFNTLTEMPVFKRFRDR